MENKEDKEPLYRQRPPTKETESMRMWVSDKDKYPDEFKESSERDKSDDIIISYKDTEFNICGFNRAIDPKTEKLMFAWKIKHEDRLVLIYNPSNDKKIEPLIEMMNKLGYEVKDVMDTLISAYNEIPKEDLEKQKNENKNKQNK